MKIARSQSISLLLRRKPFTAWRHQLAHAHSACRLRIRWQRAPGWMLRPCTKNANQWADSVGFAEEAAIDGRRRSTRWDRGRVAAPPTGDRALCGIPAPTPRQAKLEQTTVDIVATRDTRSVTARVADALGIQGRSLQVPPKWVQSGATWSALGFGAVRRCASTFGRRCSRREDADPCHAGWRTSAHPGFVLAPGVKLASPKGARRAKKACLRQRQSEVLIRRSSRSCMASTRQGQLVNMQAPRAWPRPKGRGRPPQFPAQPPSPGVARRTLYRRGLTAG